MKKIVLLATIASLGACVGYKDGSREMSPTFGDVGRHNIAVQAEAAKTDTGTTDGARQARAIELYRTNRTPAPTATRASEVGAVASPSTPR